jgi:hypothetical protein
VTFEEINNNKAFITGKVIGEPEYSHEVMGEGFYNIQVEVKRLSEQCDLIPVTVSERLLFGFDTLDGAMVSISGQFRSYNKLEDNKSRLILTLFARELTEPDYSRNPNSIEITGYVCKPPIYRVTPFKREICDLLIAVNRAYNKSDYIPCIAWGRNARFAGNFAVGERVTVTGRIQSREYQKTVDDETTTKIAYEVSVSKINVNREGDGEPTQI